MGNKKLNQKFKFDWFREESTDKSQSLKSDSIQVNDLIREYYKSKADLSIVSLRTDKVRITKWIIPYFGKVNIQEIDRDMLLSWYYKLKKHLGPRSIKHIVSLFRGILDVGIQIFGLDENPIRKMSFKSNNIKYLPEEILDEYLITINYKPKDRRFFYYTPYEYRSYLVRKWEVHWLKPIISHEFRHSFAIKPISQGIPVNFVTQWLGHSRISTALDFYTQGNRKRSKPF